MREILTVLLVRYWYWLLYPILSAVFYKALRRMRRRRWEAFTKVFGFEPPSPEQDLDKIRIAQRQVNAKLKVLAKAYAKLDLCEREVAEKTKEAKSSLKSEHYKIKARRARQAVELAKNKFWYVHGIAKAFGFHVREKYTDYLFGELRRKVLGLPQLRRGGHGSA